MNTLLAILAFSNPLEHVVEQPLLTFRINSVNVVFSNHMLMILVAAALLLIFLPLAARQKSLVPRGLRNFFEAICALIREEMVRPALGEHTDRYISYIWTTFFFILTCNLLGMVPSDSIIRLLSLNHLKNLGGTATANIWVTGTLAGCSFFVIHVSGIRRQGLWHYLKNFIPRVPWPLIPMMYILEMIGAVVKPFALAIRLFANMLAGHTVIAALLGIVIAGRNYSLWTATVLGCTALSLLELLVAVIQAYIFTFLTAMFIATAVQPEH